MFMICFEIPGMSGLKDIMHDYCVCTINIMICSLSYHFNIEGNIIEVFGKIYNLGMKIKDHV